MTTLDTTEKPVISVAELGRRLKSAAEHVTEGEWVEGEVASLKRAASGHVYFTLRDEREDAAVDCVMYRSAALRARQCLLDGSRIQVLGKASFWAPRGRLQFVAERARPAGRGALLEALERLKKKLEAEGLFDAARKRPLPSSPAIIGVVTSSHGAAFQDICSVAYRRGAGRIVLSPASVQGEGAAESIIAALDLLERYPGVDVIIVGRGGGAAEDLMAFNDEQVVRRLARASVPIVSAVGHDIDTTLSDHVCDVRAATPSQAAEIVFPDLVQRAERLSGIAARLTFSTQARLRDDRATLSNLRSRLADPRFVLAERHMLVDDLTLGLERCVKRLVAERRALHRSAEARLERQNPRVVLATARVRLGPADARLRAAMQLRLRDAKSQLRDRAGQLQSMSPLAVLGRGYAIASNADGNLLRDSTDVMVGDDIGVQLHRGSVTARVVAVAPEESRGRAADARLASLGIEGASVDSFVVEGTEGDGNGN